MSLQVDQLYLDYGREPIVKGVSCQIPDGRISCLIGPNGCGKSTLLRGLSGLLSPRQGQALLDGRPLAQWPRRALALQVAMLPQKPLAPEGIRVEQLVGHGRFPYQGLFRGADRRDREAVRWAMQQTDVAHYAEQPVQSLSGGEQQRVWIAMALAQEARILILDEPTTFLDWGHQLEVLELLAELNRSRELTVVMSLHDLNQAAQFGDHILAMEAGRLVDSGRPQEVINPPLLDRVFGVSAEVMLTDQQRPFCMARGTVARRQSV